MDELNYLLVFIIPAVIVSLFLELIIHELGHLIAGLFCGYRFMYFGILGLYIEKRDGKVQIRFHKGEPRGQCVMKPRYMGSAVKKLSNAKGIIIGGIVSEAVAGMVCFVILCIRILLDNGDYQKILADGYVLISLLVLSLVCLAGAMVNLFSNSPFSDGRTFFEIQEDPRLAACYNKIMEIGFLNFSGKSFLEMPADLFRCEGDERSALKKELKLYSYFRTLEIDPFADAAREALIDLKKDAGAGAFIEDINIEDCILDMISRGKLSHTRIKNRGGARFALMMAFLKDIPAGEIFETETKKALYPGDWISAKNTYNKAKEVLL